MTVIGPIRRDAGKGAPAQVSRGASVLQGFKAHAGNSLRAASLPVRASGAGQPEVSFEKRKALHALRIEGTPEKKLDGMFLGSDGFAYPADKFKSSEVPTFRPKDGGAPATTSYYLNGIDASPSGVASEAQRIADATGKALAPIYNAREGIKSDMLQVAKDRMRLGRNEAAETLSELVYSDLKAGKPVDLVGYSHGSAIVARALNDVEQHLRRDRGGPLALLFDKDGREEIDAAMGKIGVTTFAGVDGAFPSGIKLEAHVNEKDPLTNALGLHRAAWVDGVKGILSAFLPGAAILFGESAPAPRNTKLNQFSEPAPGGDPHQLDSYLRHYERR